MLPDSKQITQVEPCCSSVIAKQVSPLGKKLLTFPPDPFCITRQVSDLCEYQVRGYFLQNEKSFLKMCSLKCRLTINNTIQCNYNSSMIPTLLSCPLPQLQRVKSLYPSGFLQALPPTSHFAWDHLITFPKVYFSSEWLPDHICFSLFYTKW